MRTESTGVINQHAWSSQICANIKTDELCCCFLVKVSAGTTSKQGNQGLLNHHIIIFSLHTIIQYLGGLCSCPCVWFVTSHLNSLTPLGHVTRGWVVLLTCRVGGTCQKMSNLPHHGWKLSFKSRCQIPGQIQAISKLQVPSNRAASPAHSSNRNTQAGSQNLH